MDIRKPTPEEEAAFFGHRDPCIIDLFAGFIGGDCVAMAGVLRDPRYHGSLFEEDGDRIGFLSLAPGAAPLGMKAVRAMRRYLARSEEPVVVMHDFGEPKAERLLKLIGLAPTERFEPDFRQPTQKLRVWTWQPPQQ